MVKACLHREWLLVQRNSFVYVFKAVQVTFCFQLSTSSLSARLAVY